MNALLSVWEKEGIVKFATQLHELNFNLFASGGTAVKLSGAGLPVTKVGINILDHRVATLMPEVHAGLLADPAKHQDEMTELGYRFFDLVCVDLYPLEDQIATDPTEALVIEKTDIGGPTMLRAAAKGRKIVISRPELRTFVITWLTAGRPNEDFIRTVLAATAEFDVKQYCDMSAIYLDKLCREKRPDQLHRAAYDIVVNSLPHNAGVPPEH